MTTTLMDDSAFEDIMLGSSTSTDLYTETQRRVLEIVPIFTGTLSLIGSGIVVYVILNDYKRKLRHVYHRLMLAVSAIQLPFSLMTALSFLMLPDPHGPGTIHTCDIQGFFITFGLTALWYHTYLSLYYVVVIKYGAKERFIAKYVEPWLHFVAIGYNLGLSTYAWTQKMFNPLSNVLRGWCFVVENPVRCNTLDDVECIRGDAAHFVTHLTFTFPGPLACISVCTCMLVIYCHVRQQQRRMHQKYRATAASSAARRHVSFNSQISQLAMSVSGGAAGMEEKRVRMKNKQHTFGRRQQQTFRQAGLYVLAMMPAYLFFVPVEFAGLPQDTSEYRAFYFTFALLIKIFFPLQGFWSCIIFMRPRYIAISAKLKGEQESNSVWTILRCVVRGDRPNEAKYNASIRRMQCSRWSVHSDNSAADDDEAFDDDLANDHDPCYDDTSEAKEEESYSCEFRIEHPDKAGEYQPSSEFRIPEADDEAAANRTMIVSTSLYRHSRPYDFGKQIPAADEIMCNNQPQSHLQQPLPPPPPDRYSPTVTPVYERKFLKGIIDVEKRSNAASGSDVSYNRRSPGSDISYVA